MTSWGTMQPGPRLRTRGDVARRPTEFVRNLRDLCPLASAAHPNQRTFVDAETQTDVEITGEVSPIFVVRAAHAEIERRVELGGDGSTQLELDALAQAWDRRLRASRRARRTRRRGTRTGSRIRSTAGPSYCPPAPVFVIDMVRHLHAATRCESDDFLMVPTGAAEAASREHGSRAEGESVSSPGIPTQPRRTGMRSPPIGRMAAFRGRRHPPAEELGDTDEEAQDARDDSLG